MKASAFSALLDGLEVPRGGMLYVQSSTDWLSQAGFTPAETLQGLRDWIGSTGTLVMPAYPCKTTHFEYLSGKPTYDVRKTPAGLGLIPEVFRRMPNVVRSLDPDFCIAAEGVANRDVTESALDEDPFGATSTYQRLLDRDATLVGLGVSLNTHSFIHVIDSRMQSSYRRKPYAGSFEVGLVDYDGRKRVVKRLALARPFQQLTRPGAVVERIGSAAMFAQTSINGSIFFRWSLQPWARWCHQHAVEATQRGRLPCWLERLDSEPQIAPITQTRS